MDVDNVGLSGRSGWDRKEWEAIIILLYVFGSAVVSVRGRRWKPGAS